MHLIDTSNNRANMAYVGRRPWHGLGTELPAGQPLEVWLTTAGLDFEYRSADVQFNVGPHEGFDNWLTKMPGRHVLYRSDTRAPLSIVSDRYHAVQPREVIEFFRDLTEDHGFAMETAGSLKGGGVVWALARTGDNVVLGGKDEVQQYVLLMTSCDLSLATRATVTPIRVVCWNTLSLALARTASLVVTRHTRQFDAGRTKRNLGLVESTWAEFTDHARAMTKTKLSAIDARVAVIEIFGDPDKPVDEQPNQRAMADVIRLFDGQGRGSSFTTAQGTAWGLLNAVTEYVDHHAPERKDGARLLSAWSGRGDALKRKAYRVALNRAA